MLIMLIRKLPGGPPAALILSIVMSVTGLVHPVPEQQVPARLTADLVKTGLYVISGGGGNSLLRLSANGLIVVDGKLPGNYEALVALTKQISFSDQPIRILITTDHHAEHTGNNSNFIADGVHILAHENVK